MCKIAIRGWIANAAARFSGWPGSVNAQAQHADIVHRHSITWQGKDQDVGTAGVGGQDPGQLAAGMATVPERGS